MIDAPPRTTRSSSSHDRRAAKNNALVVPRRALDASCVATSLATTASATATTPPPTPAPTGPRARPALHRHAGTRRDAGLADAALQNETPTTTASARCGPECRVLRLRPHLRVQAPQRRLPRRARHRCGAALIVERFDYVDKAVAYTGTASFVNFAVNYGGAEFDYPD